MGTNGVTMTDAQLQARALEIQKFYAESGMTLPESFKDKKTGALFTYKKGEDGKITCTYDYHDEKTKNLIFFERKTVPTSRAGLGYLTDAQFEEFKQNNPHHFYQSQYAAGDSAVFLKNHAQSYINSYDKDTRNQTRDDYQNIVTEELMASGTFDKKSAKKMGKYAKKDAIAEERSAMRTVYIDKTEFEIAETRLKAEQKIAKKRIKAFNDSGRSYESLSSQEKIQLELDMAKMEESVDYIKNKKVREYINDPKNRERFFVVNPETGRFEFSSDLYKEWAKSHTQGDNTLTTSERENAAVATGLSKKQMKKAVEYAGLDTQKDHTLKIELAKSLVGLISGPLIAYMTNANIHDVKELKDRIEIVADAADPGKYTVFVDGVSIAEARSEVIANFRNVATRNAALSSALALVFNNGLIDPEKARDSKADAITAATISTQNIFRGKEVTDIEGELVIDGCDDEEGCQAALQKVTSEGEDKPEDVKYEKSYFKETDELSYWYDFVNAYDFDTKKYSIKDIYRAIQRRNGYTAEKPNPPLNVMLPLDLTLADGTKIATRKKEYTIPRHKRPTGRGNGKGNAPGGKPELVQIPGTTEYRVFDCDGRLVPGKFTEQTAREKYKEITGQEYQGEIPEA